MREARIVVVGGGVAGLAVAYRLLRADPGASVTVLEAEAVPGGKLRTVEVGDLLLEAGPDAFVARKPGAVELCRDLGLDLEEPATQAAFLWTGRGLVPFPRSAFGVPGTPLELARWPAISARGKVRALADLLRRPRREEADESVGSLVRRRLGDEVADAVVGPLLAGLFAGDIDALSVEATFPELRRWEREHGSLILGARAALRAAEERPRPMFVRPRGGVVRLVDALVAALGPGRLVASVRASAVRRREGGFRVVAGDAEHPADAVILATPAFVAAGLVEELAPAAARQLRAIPYRSTGVVALVYPEGTGSRLPHASGFLVPRERAAMTACTFVSRKWPEPAFGDRAVLRCFVGGAGAEDLLEVEDAALVLGVARQLGAVLPLPPAPEAWRVTRWPRSMPQYEVGHAERVRAAASALPPGIFLVGSAYRGPGVADVAADAARTAEAVVGYVAEARAREGETTWTS